MAEVFDLRDFEGLYIGYGPTGVYDKGEESKMCNYGVQIILFRCRAYN